MHVSVGSSLSISTQGNCVMVGGPYLERKREGARENERGREKGREGEKVIEN